MKLPTRWRHLKPYLNDNSHAIKMKYAYAGLLFLAFVFINYAGQIPYGWDVFLNVVAVLATFKFFYALLVSIQAWRRNKKTRVTSDNTTPIKLNIVTWPGVFERPPD